jgi:transmembrane sensor
MNPSSNLPDSIRIAAANWTVRRDRGLSATESIQYELWLAADPRHGEAIRRNAAAWTRLDQLPESLATSVLASAARRRALRRRWFGFGSLAAAAAVVWFISVPRGTTPPAAPSAIAAATGIPRSLTLSDGTLVQLNTGSELLEQFTPGERRVQLVRGEAHFAVTKNHVRPFVVQAGNIAIRAVGTAFNVNLQSASIDVLVLEGSVQVEPPPAAEAVAPLPLLNAGQRAVVALAPLSAAAAVVVTTLSPEEVVRTLAWQEPLMRLGGATLAEVAAGFEARTGRRVILADTSLAGLRLGGRFRADDIDGFAQLLMTLQIEVERHADGTLVLRKKTGIPDNGK